MWFNRTDLDLDVIELIDSHRFFMYLKIVFQWKSIDYRKRAEMFRLAQLMKDRGSSWRYPCWNLPNCSNWVACLADNLIIFQDRTQGRHVMAHFTIRKSPVRHAQGLWMFVPSITILAARLTWPWTRWIPSLWCVVPDDHLGNSLEMLSRDLWLSFNSRERIVPFNWIAE